MSELKSETETKTKTHEVRGTKKKKKPARQIEAMRGPLSSGGKKETRTKHVQRERAEYECCKVGFTAPLKRFRDRANQNGARMSSTSLPLKADTVLLLHSDQFYKTSCHLSFTSHNIHYITPITRHCHANILPTWREKRKINQKRCYFLSLLIFHRF